MIGGVRLIPFLVGGVTLHVPAASAHSVVERGDLIAVPRPRRGVAGLVLHEERLVPVVDLAEMLALPRGRGSLLMLVDVNDLRLAFPVDHVDGMVTADASDLGHPRGRETAIPAMFARAVLRDSAGRDLLVLHLPRLAAYLAFKDEGTRIA